MNGSIAYDERGAGPLIVCVPSMGDVRGEYRFLAPRLAAAGLRVVTMDVRGHGESSTEWPDFSVAGVGADIVALVRELDAGPALVVGTSMAAGAAVWAAAEAPEVVAGMVLIGPFVRGEAASGLARLFYGLLFGGPWGPAFWLRYYASLYPSAKPADFGEYLAALGANLREPGRLMALRQMILASKRASEERLPRVKAPVLVVMGSRDPDFKNPAEEAGWVAGQLNATLRMVEGAGHYPHAEMPEQVAPAIVEFARSVLQPVQA
ncbi:MAG TPA: alpha/beta hydrolase [Ardenticatenaceae bacterium]|nr:alpha/beta hydrolase [Ardenticatenaceae bacterium]